MANNYEQANYRVRDDTASIDADSGWLANENVDPAAQGTGTANRFRIRFTVGNNNNKAATLTPTLFGSRNSGAFTGEEFAVTASSSFVQVTDGVPADGASIATQLLGNASQGAWEAEGSYDEGDGVTPTFSHEKQGFTEFEFCLYFVDADVNNNDTLDFQVADSTILPVTVTNQPQVTVSKPGAAVIPPLVVAPYEAIN